ncbi:YgjP-like metallopeptidase domain-containing protein [Erythrobacter sp. Alg231-14]|uniref:YgjP-like metallopeptidase domain-containing protein n=1 Tax=Erythrobacter sp. Alg231-14 TaxID=1922225 RepID=UPI000D5525A1
MIDWLKRSTFEKDADPQIELNGVPTSIVLRRHATAKRMTLRLAPDGSEVRITLPRWARTDEAVAFANARHEWLTTQHAKIPQRQILGPDSEIFYRGETRRVDWEEAAPRQPVLAGNTIRLGGALAGLETRLKRWMEREALALFEIDMVDYTANASLSPVPVALSRAQKRWGSCSEKSRIRLNWRLVQAPDFVRRSVVAHEVAHLIHFDHSPAFYALLGAIYEDDLKTADRWLKEKGRTLYTSFG